MSLGGLSGVRAGGPNSQQGQGANANGESSGKEFALEQQQSGQVALLSNVAASKARTAKIVDRKKRNRKGAPRTIIVDGEIYEVFLVAIA